MQKMILRITMILLIALSCSDNTEMEPSNFDYLFEETKFVVGGNEYRAVPNKSRAFIIYNQSMANKVMEVIETNNFSFEEGWNMCFSYGVTTPQELQNTLCGFVNGNDLIPVFEMVEDLVYCSPDYHVENNPFIYKASNLVLFKVSSKYSKDLDSVKLLCKKYNAIFIDMLESYTRYGLIACTNKTQMTAMQFAYLLYESGYVNYAQCLSMSVAEPD